MKRPTSTTSSGLRRWRMRVLFPAAVSAVLAGCPKSHLTLPEDAPLDASAAGLHPLEDASVSRDAPPTFDVREAGLDAHAEGSFSDSEIDAHVIDASPKDAGIRERDVLEPPALCEVNSTSDLPGVVLEIDEYPCEISVGELREQGAEFTYRVRVGSSLEGVTSNLASSEGRCVRPGPSGLAVLVSVNFNDEVYCGWCIDRCSAVESVEQLVPGEHVSMTRWWGRSLSDSDRVGVFASPGEALLRMRSYGIRRKDGREEPFHVEAQGRFVITP